MRKTLCVFAAAFAWGSAVAAWELVGDGEAVSHYYDPASIQRRGTIGSVDILHDMKVRSRHGELSARYTAELDCEHERWRLDRFTSYEGNREMGRVIAEYRSGPDEAPREWRPLPGDSGFMRIFHSVCGD
ncbi:surface-adhesin E family protein [Azonexus sp.]|uniref:surface-adhesin E family protein n=1 Tax=Azonexus sp. TaxID=1872668 RepID=UPI0035B49E17